MNRMILCAVLSVSASGCTTLAERSLSSKPGSPSGQPPQEATPAPAQGGPHCGFISPVSPRYGSQLATVSGQPGDRVEVFGPTFRGEDGRFAPSTRLEVWWNAKISQHGFSEAAPFDPGPVLLLATVQDMDRCRFRTTFEVPAVQPGKYKVRTFVYDKSGYGWFGRHHFTVEPTT